ncbi:MAG: peptidoglycan-associated lipoprotein Pal [Proteobacteria bacterium]|nr:peptidoglycan-associated lipoprotein Pal [Pseudomonadota bacterium]
MSMRTTISVVLILSVALLFTGCKRKVVIEGEGKQEAIAGEGMLTEEEKLAREKEQIEASLETKKYAGIEGEVLESSMLRDIHFPFDRYDLSPTAREVLASNADFILKFPEAKIQIEGHADERGTNEYNLALGMRRSTAAKNYLVSLGVPAQRFSTISYGEELPVDPRHNEEAWAKNRRAHFVILSR